MKSTQKRPSFFDLFDQHAANVVTMARELRELFHSFDVLDERQARIKDLEHKCDELTHAVFTQMAATFVTPLDKEDIGGLAAGLDDIADSIDAVGVRTLIYQLPESCQEARELADLLLQSAELVQKAVNALRSVSKNKQTVIDAARALHKLENESDTVYRAGIARILNAPNPDPILVIKWKEILDRLEMAVDTCEDVSNVIESVQIKYS